MLCQQGKVSGVNENLVRFLAAYSRRYYKENLAELDPRTIRSNWWESFDFFLAKSFTKVASTKCRGKCIARPRRFSYHNSKMTNEITILHFRDRMVGRA